MPTPKPGSPEAVKLGCKCPVLDNSHGAGRGDGTWWINGACPMHGTAAFEAVCAAAFDAKEVPNG